MFLVYQSILSGNEVKEIWLDQQKHSMPNFQNGQLRPSNHQLEY